MMYWVLYGILTVNSFTTTNIHIFDPVIFSTAERCLEIRELNIKKHQHSNEKISLECQKTKVEK